MRIVVIGAGVTGVTAAYFLAKAGHEVVVVDRRPGPAAECSYANGCQLSYCYTESLASPDTLKSMPSLLFSPNSPLFFKWGSILSMKRWMLEFLKNCTTEKTIANSRKVFELAFYSKDALDELMEDCPVHFDYAKSGRLDFFQKKHSFKESKMKLDRLSDLGFPREEVLDADQCVKKEPSLINVRHRMVGGIYADIDDVGDVHKFTYGLYEYLAEPPYNVKFIYNKEINHIREENGKIAELVTEDAYSIKGEAFVVSAGAYSPMLLNRMGIRTNIHPLKGYSLTVPITGDAPITSIKDNYNRVVYARLGDRLRIAGMLGFVGHNDSVDPKKTAFLKKIAQKTFPDAANYEIAEEWGCLRPGTPDGVPLISRAKHPNLYLNTGHGMLGWTLAAGSGKRLASLISLASKK